MTPPLEGRPIKAKGAPSLHEVRLTPLDTNPVFQCLGECEKICEKLVYKHLETIERVKK